MKDGAYVCSFLVHVSLLAQMSFAVEIITIFEHLSAVDRLLQYDRCELFLLLCLAVCVWIARRIYVRCQQRRRVQRLTYRTGDVRSRASYLHDD